MGELSCLHDHVMTVMIMVIILITYIMLLMLMSSNFYKNLSEGTFIETIWSIIPAMLLPVLLIPSMSILYGMEDSKSPNLSFKIIAHQWYWTYISPLFMNMSYFFNGEKLDNMEYDSLPIMDSSESSSPRLLEASSSLFLPAEMSSRLLISSTDVIHSFAVPSLGLKADAFPGRINQLFTTPSRVGLFFGQCSEICGSNHSFMPIKVKISSIADYNSLAKKDLIDLVLSNSS